MGGRLFGVSADRVGDDPWRARKSHANGVSGPVGMVVGSGEELRNPDQYFEADDLSGEQARGERCHDAREDSCGSEEKAYGSDISPEHLRGWNPLGDPS